MSRSVKQVDSNISFIAPLSRLWMLEGEVEWGQAGGVNICQAKLNLKLICPHLSSLPHSRNIHNMNQNKQENSYFGGNHIE